LPFERFFFKTPFGPNDKSQSWRVQLLLVEEKKIVLFGVFIAKFLGHMKNMTSKFVNKSTQNHQFFFLNQK